MADGYLIGPNLREKLRVTIDRVDEMPYGRRPTPIPTRFEDVPRGGLKLSRGTFTGSWSIGQTLAVTIHGSTNTISVTNYCSPIVGSSNATQSCNVVFGSVMGTVSVVEIQQPTCTLSVNGLDMTQLPGYDANYVQLLGHGMGAMGGTACAGLRWYSVTQCGATAA